MKAILSFGASAPYRAAGVVLAGALLLSSCSEQRQQIYNASNTGGDYAILTCEELRVAALSIDQRLGGSASYTNSGEPTTLLQAHRASVAEAGQTRDCPGIDVPAPAEAPVIADTQPIVNTPAEVVRSGRFLQVATFRKPGNRDRTVIKLTSEGFDVDVRPIQLAGGVYYRVVVGPLATRAEIARLDRSNRRMGFDDAFFVIQ